MVQWTRSSCKLLVTYGVTEVTVYQTIHHASVADVDAPRNLVRGSLIGNALPGVGVAIVGSDEIPVSKGQAGQIVLFGPQLAFGYAGEHSAAVSAFRILHLDIGEERVDLPAYFTGDGGTMLSDGQLLFHGRCKHLQACCATTKLSPSFSQERFTSQSTRSPR
jgi:acyl-coenzyme A synthetase/AMP-(fatty) acid ligase